MNKIASNLYTAAAKMDASKVRVAVFVISLVMFVVAAGAPDAGGSFIH